MIIRNVNIFTEDKQFVPGTIMCEKDRISNVVFDGTPHGRLNVGAEYDEPDEGPHGGLHAAPDYDEVIDGNGAYAIPGLIDIHFHGCMGDDFSDGNLEGIKRIADYEASIGVTAMVPATMTLPVDELVRILKTAADFKDKQNNNLCHGADLLGINMEGPFISKAKKGAQDANNIIPFDVKTYRLFQDAAKGLVKFIGIAPEEGDAKAFINAVKDEVNVAVAHTNADYDCAKAAFMAGADHAVHLYNAMPPFLNREPGVVGAVADCENVMAEIICDGIHIHPAVVRATFRMIDSDRLILISDSLRATGMPDGTYKLGGQDFVLKGKRANMVLDGALAGSVTSLPDCVRTAVKEMNLPLETMIACATMNPAKSAGVYSDYGSISVGKKADIVLWDKNLNLLKVIKDGKTYFDNNA